MRLSIVPVLLFAVGDAYGMGDPLVLYFFAAKNFVVLALLAYVLLSSTGRRRKLASLAVIFAGVTFLVALFMVPNYNRYQPIIEGVSIIVLVVTVFLVLLLSRRGS